MSFGNSPFLPTTTYQPNSVNFSSTGEIIRFSSDGLGTVRYLVANAGVLNKVTISGSLDDINYTIIRTQTDNGGALCSTHGFAFIKFDCTVYGGLSFDLSYKGDSERNELTSAGSIEASSVIIFDGLVPSAYSKVIIARDPNTELATNLKYFDNVLLVADVDLTYDSNENLILIERVGPP